MFVLLEYKIFMVVYKVVSMNLGFYLLIWIIYIIIFLKLLLKICGRIVIYGVLMKNEVSCKDGVLVIEIMKFILFILIFFIREYTFLK